MITTIFISRINQLNVKLEIILPVYYTDESINETIIFTLDVKVYINTPNNVWSIRGLNL